MDEATRRTYIRARLTKAHEDFATARDNLAHGYLRAAVNRAYYTVFHVASAALLWHDIQRSRHSGVQSAFGEFLVKPGIIEREFGRIYTRAMKIREEQDYDLRAVSLTEQQTDQIIREAEHFVARLEQYLEDVGAIS